MNQVHMVVSFNGVLGGLFANNLRLQALATPNHLPLSGHTVYKG